MATPGKSIEQLEEEAREWIEAITGEDFMDSGNFVASLGDGVLLCKCVEGGRGGNLRAATWQPPHTLCRAPASPLAPPHPHPPTPTPFLATGW